MFFSSSPINPYSQNQSTNNTDASTNLLHDAPLVILNLLISTKLNRSNFLAWKSQILLALHGHDLFRYLDEDPPLKNITVEGVEKSNPAYFHWYKQDQLLLTWIRSLLSETILNQVVSVSSSRARLTELCRSLQNTTNGGSSCFDFCQRII